jgi:hypothetical protein
MTLVTVPEVDLESALLTLRLLSVPETVNAVELPPDPPLPVPDPLLVLLPFEDPELPQAVMARATIMYPMWSNSEMRLMHTIVGQS